MGADLSLDLDRGRRARLHRPLGRLLFYIFVVIFLVLLVLGLTIFRA
jgi:hypothetical protein